MTYEPHFKLIPYMSKAEIINWGSAEGNILCFSSSPWGYIDMA